MSKHPKRPARVVVPYLQEFRAENARLHECFCAGDRQAGSELCQRLYPPLIERMRWRYRRTRDELRWTAAVNAALFSYWKEPGKFDPAGCALDIYLFWVSRRNYCNEAEGVRRRHARWLAWLTANVTLFIENGCRLKYREAEEAARTEAREKLARLIALLRDPIERVFALMLSQDIRGTADYVRALVSADPSLAGALPDDLKQRVKKIKDRVKVKLKSWAKE